MKYQLARCPSCSLVWLKDPPPPSKMGNHYGVDYDRAISTGGDDPDHWTDRQQALSRMKPGGVLLDLGCSSGGFLRAMKGPSWQLCGIEMSPEVARVAESTTGAQVFVGDILEAPFPDNSFDAITCFHVFEHMYHPREILSRVKTWLKPGGVFYTMMPNIDSAGLRIFKSYWYALELPRHLYHFSPASLRNLAASVGLKEVSVTTHREVFIEQSVRYLVDDAWEAVGVKRKPMSQDRIPSIPYRTVRKAFRLTLLPLLSASASLAGDGESIHAVFTKE